MSSSGELYARVVFDLPVDQEFDYLVPPALRERLRPGHRVYAPFGKRKLVGFCVALSARTEVADRTKRRALFGVLDEVPLVGVPMLSLTRWLSRYYCCSWGEALVAAIPASVRRGHQEQTIMTVVPVLTQEELRTRLADIRKASPKRARLLEILDAWQGDATLPELIQAAQCSAAVVKTAQKKGLVRFVRKSAPPDPLQNIEVPREAPLVPSAEQAAALERIRALLKAGQGGTVLIHGVTGSGKTEIYLQAIAETVAAGRQAIVLVPEISLTPQTVRRFRARFDRVAVLHSHLTDADRYAQWCAIAQGKADVVVGARSAIFAPIPSLGLIVVDEEHETSFKQESSPRYHARDVAVVRGTLEKAVVLLGSATPSLESYRNALSGKYHHIELTARVEERPMPTVQIVDMVREGDELKGMPLLSRHLKGRIQECLARHEQVILFVNRRGFSTLISCSLCHHVLRCKHCTIPLTYHERLKRAICHHCGYEVFLDTLCPECATSNVKFHGMGTERVEDEVARSFPEARIVRMDSDTMRGRGAHERALADFAAGRTDILVGTQMIAKGLDFPNVTLVGVLGADMMLNLPDFRSCERTFQLLAQVAGRTGRGSLGGLVIIQSYVADHYSIATAAQHNFKAFAQQELIHRRELYYPPFSRLVRLIVQGRREQLVQQRCRAIARLVLPLIEKRRTRMLGPSPCPILKIRDRFRWHVILKAPDTRTVEDLARQLAPEIARKSTTQVIMDVDPVIMM